MTTACSATTQVEPSARALQTEVPLALDEPRVEPLTQEEYLELDLEQPLTPASLSAALNYTAETSPHRFLATGTVATGDESVVVVRDGLASADASTGQGLFRTGRGDVSEDDRRLPELTSPILGEANYLSVAEFEEYRVANGLLWRSIDGVLSAPLGSAWMASTIDDLDQGGTTASRVIDAKFYLDAIGQAIIGIDGPESTEVLRSEVRRVSVILDGDRLSLVFPDLFRSAGSTAGTALQATVQVSELATVTFVDIDASPWGLEARQTIAFSQIPDGDHSGRCLSGPLLVSLDDEVGPSDGDTALVATRDIPSRTRLEDIAESPSEWFVERRLPLGIACEEQATTTDQQPRPTSLAELEHRQDEVVYNGLELGQVVRSNDFGILFSQVLTAIAEIPIGTSVGDLVESPTTWLMAQVVPESEFAQSAISSVAELQQLDPATRLNRLVLPGEQLLAPWFEAPS